MATLQPALLEALVRLAELAERPAVLWLDGELEEVGLSAELVRLLVQYLELRFYP